MKFSIVTITHNRAHLIKATIQSVLNQTYSKFEHIVIDDGSTDGTEKVINDFKDDRIKYFKYEKHSYRSFLRNEGIRKSKGEIICILDSDDLWHKNKLATLFELFTTQNKIEFIFHNVCLLDSENKELDHLYTYKKSFYRFVLNEMFDDTLLPYPFYSFRKSLLDTIEIYDEQMVDGQHDFFLRVAAIYPIYYSPNILAYKVHHEKNLSKKFRVSALINYIISLKKLYKNEHISTQEYSKMINATYYKIAIYYTNINEKKEALKYLNDIIKDASRLEKIFFLAQVLRFKNKYSINLKSSFSNL